MTTIKTILFMLTIGMGAKAQPVSTSTSNMVDLYSGDFHYSVPLLTVPGPNGESVNISANYHAGIRVDEKASWLGLGWDYNPGEISRQVVGAPDDWNGKTVYTFEYNSVTPFGLEAKTATAYYGAMYNNHINDIPSFSSGYNTCTTGIPPASGPYTFNKSTDYLAVNSPIPTNDWLRVSTNVHASVSNLPMRFKRYSLPYESLAYDNYMVSGPVSGMMKPYFIEPQRIHRSGPYYLNGHYIAAHSTLPVQFYMENSSNHTVTSPSDASVMNTSTNRIKSGTFIKYYTNADINNSANLFDNSSQAGFLDYHTVSGTRRPSTSYDPDGIGAYEITSQDGMTYHYSLPVYAFNEIDKVLQTLASGVPTSVLVTAKPESYASSWKLTAVTGPDYQDSNNNHVVDMGDSGYWIAYNYSAWSGNYQWSTSQYNYKDDMYSPSMYCMPGNYGGPQNANYLAATYKLKKSLTTGHMQVYYLNYIQTSTHTALFVKSLRKDEQSYDKVLGMASKPTPLLKLDKIVLLRNEDLGNILTTAVPLSGTNLDGRFSYASCTSAQSDVNFMNASKYNHYKSAIDQKSLKSAELLTDYSLCRKYHDNINNTFSVTSRTTATGANKCDHDLFNGNNVIYVQYDKTASGAFSSSDYNNSGKLTLNSIAFYDISSEKVTPSVDFDYAKADSGKNPDYDADKTDLWGYYKSDYVSDGSHYPTNAASLHTDAWSLREITSPLGGKIQVTYESDRYEREGFVDDPELMLDQNSSLTIEGSVPSFIFPLKTAVDFHTLAFEYPDEAGFLSAFSAEAAVSPASQQYNLVETVIPVSATCAYSLNYYTVNNYGVSSNGGFSTSCSGGFCTDLNMLNVCPGSSFSASDYDKNYAYGYRVFKMNYVKGGGLRVASIKTIEPGRGETYTENFSYAGGYCVAVPKRLALGSSNGPTNFDLLLNDKMSIEGLSSSVGYSSVSVTQTGMSGATTGAVAYEFRNATIESPIQYIPQPYDNNNKLWAQSQVITINSSSEPRCPGISIAPATPASCVVNYHPIEDYKYTAGLRYDNEKLKLLGKLEKVSSLPANSTTPVSVVSYIYDEGASSYIRENYQEGSSTTIFQDDIPITLSSSTACPGGKYEVTCFARDLYDVSSSYQNHDCFLKSTTTMRDGISIREDVAVRDPNTGMPLKTVTYDPTQAVFTSTGTPAYLNSTYAGLGLKAVNESYKNQPGLTEQSKTFRFPYNALTYNGADEATDPHTTIVVLQSKSTFSTSYPYRVYNASTGRYENSSQTKHWWRLYETYSRLLDDLTDVSSSTVTWRKLSEGTLYDLDNNKIEETGLNNRKAASKWGYKNHYKLADISNANYNSFTFTGFEDKLEVASGTYHFGGEVTGGQYQYTYVTQVEYPSNPHLHPSVAIVNPHTGLYLARVPASTDGPAFKTRNFETGRTYVAKVWVHKASADSARLVIDLGGYRAPGGGSPPVALNIYKEVKKTDATNVTVGDWILMSLEVIVPADFNLAATHHLNVYVKNTSTAKDAFFDDFAFHPKDAVMGGNVYEEMTGLLKAQLDNDNFATLYNYDNAGRVISTYKEYSGGLKKVSENQYHFAKP